jgi:hypothetical protein
MLEFCHLISRELKKALREIAAALPKHKADSHCVFGALQFFTDPTTGIGENSKQSQQSQANISFAHSETGSTFVY